MKKTLSIITAIVVVLAIVAYFVVGATLYNQLANIEGRCQTNLENNRPDSFSNQSSFPDDFDYSPYQMESYERVTFPSRDADINIVGWYVENAPDAATVIVVHGLGSCKNSHTVLTPAGMLSNAGFNVLMIDLRDAGESDYEDGRSAIGNEEHRDALGAWDWLVEEKGIAPEKIGMVGNSLGAATALIAFDQEPRLAAVFVDSPFSNLRQIIEEELVRAGIPGFMYTAGVVNARILAGDNILEFDPQDAVLNAGDRPVFILHGTADTRIGVHHSQQMAELAEEAGTDVTVWIIDDVEHVRASRVVEAQYEKELVTFFTEALVE